MPIEHGFTPTILSIIATEYDDDNAASMLDASELLGYLNEKTKPASKGSKSRASFASLYAVYVLVEDYIANAVTQIVDAYIAAKRGAFEGFIADCEHIQKLSKKGADDAKAFIACLLKPNVDARIFEITSFAVLKEHYGQESIFWSWTEDALQQESLMLYKTGRCNANDGGIDFVMRPLGRFFQVTETTDVKKYFLDIDEVQRYPVTFVVKSELSQEDIRQKIREQAHKVYSVKSVVKRYVDCVEEIIDIPVLLERFETLADQKRISPVIEELVLQSRVEFNYDES